MNTRAKLFTVVGIAALLLGGLVVGGWFVNTAFAQGPWGGFMGMGRNNDAVLTLLNTSESDLLQQRQEGKSWLDIATASGITESDLTYALVEPLTAMSTWMTLHHPQSDVTQMTELMRQQISQDIRVAPYGTMTDMHVFGGAWRNGMMGYRNESYGFGGMMGRGMMGGWNNPPSINATPVPPAQQVDRQVNITASNFKFAPASITVNAGETVRFTIANQDKFPHNVVSRDGKLTYTALPANQTTPILWVAPNEPGIYTVNCTWHPGMQFTVVVE